MTDDLSRAAAVVDGEWGHFIDALVDGGPDIWDRPTRLRDWTVEDLARHVHWGITLEAEALTLATGGGPGRAAGQELSGPRDAVVPALRDARDWLVRALRDVPGDAVLPMPYGDVPLALALHVFVMEAAVHRGDLTAAVTGRAGIVRTAVPACAVTLQSFWPALAQGATRTPSPGTGIVLEGETVRVAGAWDGAAWGPVVDQPSVVLRGPDEELMLFALGRLSLEESGLEVTGDRDLAVGFKELLPGP